MKFKNYIFTPIIIALFFSGLNFFVEISLAQDDSGGSVIKFISKKEIEKEKTIKRIKKTVDRLKSDPRLMPFYAYKAAVVDLPSSCDSFENKKGCLLRMSDLQELYNYAIGRCDYFKDQGDKGICEALRRSDCSSIQDNNSYFECQSFLNFNPTIVKKFLKEKLDKKEIDTETYKTTLKLDTESIAYYSVFRTNTISICTKLLENYAYFHTVGCYILASNFPQEIIDRYVLDLAYYHHSIKEGNPDFCKEIKDSYIKQFCDEKIDFSIFMQEYFSHSKN